MEFRIKSPLIELNSDFGIQAVLIKDNKLIWEFKDDDMKAPSKTRVRKSNFVFKTRGIIKENPNTMKKRIKWKYKKTDSKILFCQL